MAAKKTTAKKEPAKKTPAKKSAAKKPAEKKPKEETKIDPRQMQIPDGVDLSLLELPGEDKAILEKIKLSVDGQIDSLVQDALGIFNIIIPKTYEYSIDGELLIDARTGNPKQDWNRVTPGDIKTVLLKIPVVQFSLNSFEVNSWAEAEMAKILQKEDKSAQAAYRAFFLKYAYKRIAAINEGLSNILKGWSRATELYKIDASLSR